ncbi:cytochrome c [Mucilaginibacter sp. L196]|uniref:c-type cytochrome n=1 Tax=Mucilaginibacter sp. L196 TaxID=1641870 RepID=UPI00131C51C9|nr:cytochrome c [Mucilaginibacter sp. L196]
MNFIKSASILLFLVIACNSLEAQVRHSSKSAKSHLALSIANGKLVYTQNCASCHQVDGHGVQNMNPPLIQTSYVLGDKTKLIKIILNGFNEDVEINGNTYSNTMASHDFLKDKEIADVLTYIRHSFGNKASAVSVAMVKSVRATKK